MIRNRRSHPELGHSHSTPVAYTDESMIFSKILRLRVCSICQYLLLRQQEALSTQPGVGGTKVP